MHKSGKSGPGKHSQQILSLMSKALDKDEVKETEPELCEACSFMVALPTLDNLCPDCFQKRRRAQAHPKPQPIQKDSQYEEPTLSDIETKQEDDDFWHSDDSYELERSEYETSHEEMLAKLAKEADQREINFQEVVLRPLEVEVKLEEGARQEERVCMSLKRGYPEIFQIRKDKCNYCMRRTGLLGFECGYCQVSFCKAHRLPEQHQCSDDYEGKCRKKLRQELLEGSIGKKHKGKVPQI